MALRVVFVGGRQAQRLCAIYGRLSGAPETAAWIDVVAKLQPSQEQLAASADLLALQACGAPLPLDFDEIATKAERVWFPELALDFLWPFSGQPHLANTADALFPDGPYPVELGDAWLNRRLEGRQLAEAIEAEYLALDIAATLDLDAYKTMSFERQAAFDRQCGTDFASRLEAQFAARPLFVNPLTPGGDLLHDLASGLFARMGAPFSLSPDLRPDLSRVAELAIHPSVAAHFGLAWTQGRRYRAFAGDRVDFAEYVGRYLAYAEGPELEHGVRLVEEGQTDEGVQRLEIAAARPMGRRLLSTRRALERAFVTGLRTGDASAMLRIAEASERNGADLRTAATFYAQGRWDEAEAAAMVFLAASPSSLETWLFVAHVRDKRGDGEGRVAALRAALELRPDDPVLQSQLTTAGSALGDFATSIASARAEIALNPANPHTHALLAHLFEQVGDQERAAAELKRALEIVAVGEEYADLRNALNRRRIDPDREATPD